MSFLRLCILLSVLFLLAACPPASASREPVTITVTQSAILQTLRSLLPLSFAPENDSFEGTIEIRAIDRLQIHDNLLSLDTMIAGRDVSIRTRVGGQTVRLKVGTLTMGVSCDLRLEFDPEKQILYLTPHFRMPPRERSGSAGTTLFPLLAALGNRPYPLPLNTITPFTATTGDKLLSLALEPTAVTAAEGILRISLKPRATKQPVSAPQTAARPER
ncbi:hypothetical protein GF1_01210 [Desulfolithobacter dissulfuricans]|uniref:DUF2993 domain-containing protein n=1 Tax=Desulfolithobacter dissulfuricans TaxID=2795293 RepID=A0A915U8V8_9BACT|nr:hypothetical protein [Desulfolithobacter dissulfuricans]BCO07745.1 hypothetical protein GF1_01210 [Desulfolithobacter dissulfuricans]